MENVGLKKARLPGRLGIGPFPIIYRAWCLLGVYVILRAIKRAERKTGDKLVRAVYQTHGGRSNDTALGARGLDFFIILAVERAELEMEFLKNFWRYYLRLKKFFPFYREILIGDENEIENGFRSSSLLLYRATFSWRCLHGEHIVAKYKAANFPGSEEIFRESMLCYWQLLRSFFKLNLEAGYNQEEAEHLKDIAKLSLDLLRLQKSIGAAEEECRKIWSGGIGYFLSSPPISNGSTNILSLIPFLSQRGPALEESEIYRMACRVLYEAMLCLHEISEGTELAAKQKSEASWSVRIHGSETERDFHAFSVRELFAERLLFRHKPALSTMVLSKQTTQMYAVFSEPPSIEAFHVWLRDVRSAEIPFDPLSVCMPLTERSFVHFSGRPQIRTPFFSPYAHTELKLDSNFLLESRNYRQPMPQLDLSALRSELIDLSFLIRKPPTSMSMLIERYLCHALSVRLTAFGPDFLTEPRETFSLFLDRYPLRTFFVGQAFGPILSENVSDVDTKLRDRVYLGRNFSEQFNRAVASVNFPSDLWMNITPFLRRELNAAKDRIFEVRPDLKI